MVRSGVSGRRWDKDGQGCNEIKEGSSHSILARTYTFMSSREVQEEGGRNRKAIGVAKPAS